MKKKFPILRQRGVMDCGATCLRMIAKYHGVTFSTSYVKKLTRLTKTGVSLLAISEAAEIVGFRSIGVKVDYSTLVKEGSFPCIAHWDQNHFVIIYRITDSKVWIADPAKGLLEYSKKEFLSHWSSGKEEGICMFLETTPKFFETHSNEAISRDEDDFKFIFHYAKQHKKYFIQIFFGLLVGTITLLVSPFLTQAVVDKGINYKNLNFVYIILIAQFFIFVGQTSVQIIRNWLLLHIGSRINIAMVSDFLMKLLRLPINFFESHQVGDLLQRIGDHKRVEKLLTQTGLSSLFSIINLIVFGAVLIYYDALIFGVFLAGSVLSLIWVLFFMKRRRKLDFEHFEAEAKNTERTIELLKGAREIKLNNSAQQKRWEWEEVQANLFKINLKWLGLNQVQDIGAEVLGKVKNILITFIAAKAVIEGEMTLGAMFAINSIIGQLNAPFDQLLGFALGLFDTKLSLERISELRNETDEIPEGKEFLSEIPVGEDIHLDNVSFAYDSNHTSPVIENLDVTIPGGKVTDIVVASGSGKTTLLKLLLKFFEINSGNIKVGKYELDALHSDRWREHCGTVMQDGMIFSDTIIANICLGLEEDQERFERAIELACIDDYIGSLPLGYLTKIGDEGQSLSKGQQQRLLLARAIYKNPQYLFLDEATSALDASNEKRVMENLNTLFDGKTVIIIAHRLSTVKNADKIIVLDKGKIAEFGTHQELTAAKGAYFTLVKDQLELGD